MAGGNWDYLTFDEHGNETDGRFKHDACECELYKDSLHIHSYGKHIAQIFYGDIQILEFDITASRGDRDDIYFIVCHCDKYMVGVGAYAFQEDYSIVMEEEGLDPDVYKGNSIITVTNVENGIINSRRIYEISNSLETLTFDRPNIEKYQDKQVGITSEMFDNLIKFLNEYHMPFASIIEKKRGLL